MRVDVLQSGDVVQLCQLLGLLVENAQNVLQVLHVLEDESFSLVQHQVLNVGEEVSIDLVFEHISLVINFQTGDHPHGKW